MASYYVDYVSGSDSNAGTSTGAPWQHCPGDANATSTAAGTTLVAGDTVFFHAGVEYVGSILLNWSGSSGNVITYDGTTWTGSATRAYFTNNNTSSAGSFTDNSVARSYLTFTGIHIRDNGGYASDDPIWDTIPGVTSPPDGRGIDLRGGGTNLTVTNCYFEEIGQWENRAPMDGTSSVTGTAILLENNTTVLIEGCDFTRMKTGVSIKASTTISGVTVRNCEFHNYMNWLIDIAPRAASTTIQNIDIDGCTLRDYAEFNEPNWTGYGEKPHQDGIFIRNTSVTGTTWDNIVVRNCYFLGDGSSNGGTASIYLSQGASATIYNCVFKGDKQSRSLYAAFPKPSGVSAQNINIWNNTFTDTNSPCIEIDPVGSDKVTANNIDIRNNICNRPFSFRAVAIDPSVAAGTLTMDNNVFYNTNPGQLFYTGSFRTFTGWKSYSSKDANSIEANPLVDSTTYELQEGSPAIEAGADLSAFFTTDINGVTRAAPWDIGAVASSGMPPEPPTPPAAAFPAKRKRSSAPVATRYSSFGF